MLLAAGCVAILTSWSCATADAETAQFRADLTADPKWEGRNNVPPASACMTKTTDFGFSPTSHAGGAAGAASGPVVRPDGKPRLWSIHYRPGDKARAGQITVTLDDRPVTLDVTPAMTAGNAAFDRFGLLSWHRGGHDVDIHFDDLEYTASAARTRRSSTER